MAKIDNPYAQKFFDQYKESAKNVIETAEKAEKNFGNWSEFKGDILESLIELLLAYAQFGELEKEDVYIDDIDQNVLSDIGISAYQNSGKDIEKFLNYL